MLSFPLVTKYRSNLNLLPKTHDISQFVIFEQTKLKKRSTNKSRNCLIKKHKFFTNPLIKKRKIKFHKPLDIDKLLCRRSEEAFEMLRPIPKLERPNRSFFKLTPLQIRNYKERLLIREKARNESRIFALNRIIVYYLFISIEIYIR